MHNLLIINTKKPLKEEQEIHIFEIKSHCK